MELFIDIETIPSGDQPTNEELRNAVPKTISKEETIMKWIEDNKDKVFHKRGLDPFEGQILCIVVYDPSKNEMYTILDKDEKVVLIKLYDLIVKLTAFVPNPSTTDISDPNINVGKFHKPIWIGHNVIFDLNFLFIRSIVHKIPLLKYLPNNERDYDHYEDTMKIIGYGTTDSSKKFISLEKACKLLDIPIKTSMHGSKVYDYYLEGRLEEISKYCQEDVLACVQLYNKLTK